MPPKPKPAATTASETSVRSEPVEPAEAPEETSDEKKKGKTRGRKGKGARAPAEKEYTFLTLEEVKAREQKYTNRLTDLRVCLNFVDEALIEVAQIEQQQLIEDKWQDFIECNPMPKAYIPPDIRLFFEKLKFFQTESIQRNIDWILAINERSILNQNIFRSDKTRSSLAAKMKPDFGHEYNRYINSALTVIQRIEYFLDNDLEVAKCGSSILEDIKQLKGTVQDHVSDFIDRYCYRILCSEQAYMTSVNAISAEYYFCGDNFQIHIWALKNVPIRFTHLDEPRLIVNFHAINLSMHIPSTMLSENLTIRGLRLKYDHCSENAKGFYQEITMPVDDLNAGIQDLHECLINEWLMQIDLQEQVRKVMFQKRMEYEEQMRLFEEEESKKNKRPKEAEDGKKTKHPKVSRPTREPPVVGPDVFPEVFNDFLAEEQKQYEHFIDTIYNPATLELDDDEVHMQMSLEKQTNINLKRFSILGGIYQIEYVQKPEHYDFTLDRFNMTWHKNDGKLLVHHDVYIPQTSQFLARRTTRLMSTINIRRMTKRQTMIQQQQQNQSTEAECPWFVLTLTLPEFLCNWGEPIACHFENISKFKRYEMEEPSDTDTSKKVKIGAKKAPEIPAVPSTIPQIVPPPEEELTVEPSNTEFYPYLQPYVGESRASVLKLKSFSSPRLSPGNYFRASLSVSLGNMAAQAREDDGTLNIQDFVIDMLLNKAQIRHLERHCLPRIISSFKFPKEMREEELEAYRNRPKGRGGNLIRKYVTDEDNPADSATNRVFVFNDKQNNPERMFPIYEKQEHIRILSAFMNDDQLMKAPMGPETFSQLIHMLNSIKLKYQLRIRRTLDLKPFKPRVKLENKRLKMAARKRALALLKQRELERRSTYKPKDEEHVAPKTDEDDEPKDEAKAETDELGPRKLTLSTEGHILPEWVEKEPELLNYNHWTTKHILHSEYDREKRTLVIQTDRLGILGLAFKRYEHFPFKYWSLKPSETDPDNEIIFTLETQYVRCVLVCTANGLKGHVTEAYQTFVRNPKMYLVIDQPMRDYKAFKKLFKDKYLNIFADHDACYYIENGYFSEKHLATEMHTYCCMAIHSTQMKFCWSQWNRLSKRRDIVLQFMQYKDLPENLVEVRITPEESFFVEVTELCSDDLEVIKLEYTPTWRNMGTTTDLHHLVQSMYPAATDLRCKNPKLISCIRNLLNEIRPLSYS